MVFSFQPFVSTSVLHPHHSPNGLSAQALPQSPKGESSRSQPAAGRYDGSSTRYTVTGWLVVGIPTPLKNHGVNVSWDDMTFPIYGKLKFMFQTTNQVIYIYIMYRHVYVCVCVT